MPLSSAFIKLWVHSLSTILNPTLVALQVKKDASMLDAFGKGASDDIKDAKNMLYSVGAWWRWVAKGGCS